MRLETRDLENEISHTKRNLRSSSLEIQDLSGLEVRRRRHRQHRPYCSVIALTVPRGGAEGRHRRGALDVRAGRLAAASGLRRLRRRSRPRALLVGPHHDARCRSRWPAGREALLGLRRRQRRGRVLGRQRVEARPSRQPDLPRPGGRGRRATGDRPTALPAAAAGCKRAQRRSLCCFCTSRAHRVTYE